MDQKEIDEPNAYIRASDTRVEDAESEAAEAEREPGDDCGA